MKATPIVFMAFGGVVYTCADESDRSFQLRLSYRTPGRSTLKWLYLDVAEGDIDVMRKKGNSALAGGDCTALSLSPA